MPVKQVKLTPETEERLKRWLNVKIRDIHARREQRTQDWQRWREQYEGKTGNKTFPWPGCSNVYVPITAIIVDAIHANMMNRIFGHERLWDANALRPAEQIGVNPTDNQPIVWGDAADAVQEFLAVETAPNGMVDIYDVAEEASLETVKLGTAIIYNPWVTEVVEDHVYDFETGEIIRNEPVTLHDGIRPERIPLEDFLIVPHYADVVGPKAAPLFGHQYWLRRNQLIAEDEAGRLRPGTLEKMLAFSGGPQESLKDHQANSENEVESFTTSRRDDHLLQELWIRFPLNEDGTENRLFILRHHETGTIARIQPWIYKSQPYTVMRYLRREGRFYGIGAPEQLESIQRGVNTSFNQQVDNATLANLRGYKVKSNSRLAKNFGELFPGRRWIVDQMDELEEFQLGEVYPSGFQVGLQLRDFAERRTGISDFNLGRESEVLGRSSTATTTMALLQESSRRFDLYARDMRNALSYLGMQSVELIQQFKPIGRIFATMGPEKAELVAAAIAQHSSIDLREHVRIVTTSAASAQNKEMGRQNAIAAFGLLVQYLERLFELAAVIANPQIPEGIRKMAYDMSQTGERMMQKILEGFEMDDIANFLPQLEGLVKDGQAGAAGANGPGAVGSPEGAAPGAQGAVLPGPPNNGGDAGGPGG